MDRQERLRKLRQAVCEGAVDYTCPECGTVMRGEPNAKRLWCRTCERRVEVTPVV